MQKLWHGNCHGCLVLSLELILAVLLIGTVPHELSSLPNWRLVFKACISV